MTTVKVTMASLEERSVESAYQEVCNLLQSDSVGFGVAEWGPTTPHDARNILIGESVEDPNSLWLGEFPDDNLWDIHGECCRLIVDEKDSHPKILGRTLNIDDRYDVDLKGILTGVGYPEDVMVALKQKGTPPAVIHSAPFSYDPYNDYYTEVYMK